MEERPELTSERARREETAKECRNPVFVVGLPRSGTTLLAAMLASHSRLDCGPETHFFNQISERLQEDAVGESHWPSRATRLVCSLTVNGQPVHEAFGLTFKMVETFLSAREPSIEAMLEALTLQHAARLGKGRWMEKTPIHLLELDRITRSFPDARIVRIIRDPRDVVSSLSKVPWASASPVANAFLVVDRDDASWQFFANNPCAATVRYEELVRQPALELQKLCELINENFEPAMLQVSSAAESITANGEWWKSRVGGGIDSSSIGRWRRDVTEEQARAVELICAEQLQRYGYDCSVSEGRVMRAYPLRRQFVEQNEAVFLALAGRGQVLLPGPSPLTADGRDTILVADSSVFGWGRFRRLAGLVSFAGGCLWRRAVGPRVRWIDLPAGDAAGGGRAGALMRVVLQWLGERVSLETKDQGATPGTARTPES